MSGKGVLDRRPCRITEAEAGNPEDVGQTKYLAYEEWRNKLTENFCGIPYDLSDDQELSGYIVIGLQEDHHPLRCLFRRTYIGGLKLIRIQRNERQTGKPPSKFMLEWDFTKSGTTHGNGGAEERGITRLQLYE